MGKRIYAAFLIVSFVVLLLVGSMYFSMEKETVAPQKEAAEPEHYEYLQVIDQNDDWDKIMQKARKLFDERGAEGLVSYDGDPKVCTAVFSMAATGIDRYVCRMEDGSYAMLYLNLFGGGYWWYFGEMEHGIRSGTGTTVVILPHAAYQTYSGGYKKDFPEGKGVFRYQNGLAHYAMEGTFHGPRLNGNMKCTMYNGSTWPEEVTTTLNYADGHLATPCDIAVEPGREMFMFTYLENGQYMGWENASDALNIGFEVWFGNENLLQK